VNIIASFLEDHPDLERLINDAFGGTSDTQSQPGQT